MCCAKWRLSSGGLAKSSPPPAPTDEAGGNIQHVPERERGARRRSAQARQSAGGGRLGRPGGSLCIRERDLSGASGSQDLIVARMTERSNGHKWEGSCPNPRESSEIPWKRVSPRTVQPKGLI